MYDGIECLFKIDAQLREDPFAVPDFWTQSALANPHDNRPSLFSPEELDGKISLTEV